MKRIMIDLDDVITNANFSRVIEDFLGYRPDFENFKGYYLQDTLGDKKEEFFKTFKDIDMYKYAKIMPDCYEVLKELSEEYELYICSDYIWKEMIDDSGVKVKDKYNFLYRNFDFINPKHYIFTGDKSVINCDIKIDDKVNNLNGASIKLLYTAWHNKNITEEELKEQNIIRVDNWKQIKNILLNN